MSTERKELFTVDEAARWLQISARQVREEIQRDRLKCFRIVGNRIRLSEDHLWEYLEKHPCNEAQA